MLSPTNMSKPLTFVEYKPKANSNQHGKSSHHTLPKVLYICPFPDCVQARASLVNRAMVTDGLTVVGKEGFISSQEYFRRHIAQKLETTTYDRGIPAKSEFECYCPFAECMEHYSEDTSTVYSREYAKSRTRAASWMMDHLYEHHASAICMRIVQERATITTTAPTEEVKIAEKEEICEVHLEDYNISLYNAPKEASFIGADMLWFVMRNMQFRCPKCTIHYGSLPHFNKHIKCCIIQCGMTESNPVGYCSVNSRV